jgi:RNA polymerase sigma-70 factor (ECF subfamily)
MARSPTLAAEVGPLATPGRSLNPVAIRAPAAADRVGVGPAAAAQRRTADEVLQLAERASRLDASAFADLYRLYAPQVRRFMASRLMGGQEAEDLTNTVFEKAFAAMARYRPAPARFSTWLYTIAQNTVIDHHRRRRLPGLDEPPSDVESVLDPQEDPERHVLLEEQRNRLYRALLGLTPEQRQVVGCRFFFNLPVNEVARLMGKSEGAVKALQFRALARLRRPLASEWNVE